VHVLSGLKPRSQDPSFPSSCNPYLANVARGPASTTASTAATPRARASATASRRARAPASTAASPARDQGPRHGRQRPLAVRRLPQRGLRQCRQHFRVAHEQRGLRQGRQHGRVAHDQGRRRGSDNAFPCDVVRRQKPASVADAFSCDVVRRQKAASDVLGTPGSSIELPGCKSGFRGLSRTRSTRARDRRFLFHDFRGSAVF